jgi:CrcB protein
MATSSPAHEEPRHSRLNPAELYEGSPDEQSIGDALARHNSVRTASSLAGVDRPPSKEEGVPNAKDYSPLSLPVLALLAPASVFGVLARLGLQALATYDGESVFPLAYPQTVGCFIMGFLLPLKGPMSQL